MKRSIVFLAFLVIAAVLVTGCSQPQKPGSSADISNGKGPEASGKIEEQQNGIIPGANKQKEEGIDKGPEKIVSLAPANTEIIYALGAGDKLIAVSEYCNYPGDTASKTKLPTGEKLDVENLISMKPDLVIAGYMAAMEDQYKQLEDAGIKVLVIKANSLAETYEAIETIGDAIGREKEADELVKSMKDGFESIRKEVEGKATPTVYVEVSPLEWGLWTCGRNTFIQELLNIVGARNIFDDVDGWAEVSEEQVISRNPDFIITTASPLTGIEDPIGEISSRANWSGMDAVKNGRIVMLESDMITRPGPRLLDAARELVKVLY